MRVGSAAAGTRFVCHRVLQPLGYETREREMAVPMKVRRSPARNSPRLRRRPHGPRDGRAGPGKSPARHRLPPDGVVRGRFTLSGGWPDVGGDMLLVVSPSSVRRVFEWTKNDVADTEGGVGHIPIQKPMRCATG